MRTGVKLVLFLIAFALLAAVLYKANDKIMSIVDDIHKEHELKVKKAFDRGFKTGQCDVGMQMYGVPKFLAKDYCLCAVEADEKKDSNAMKLCVQIMRSKLKNYLRERNGK